MLKGVNSMLSAMMAFLPLLLSEVFLSGIAEIKLLFPL
jgi:hypothetical protein